MVEHLGHLIEIRPSIVVEGAGELKTRGITDHLI